LVDEPAHLAELMLDQKSRILAGQRAALRHIEESRRSTEGSQRAAEFQKDHRESCLTRQPLPGDGACVARNEVGVSELLTVAKRISTVLHGVPRRSCGETDTASLTPGSRGSALTRACA
jgi:hypothetical protein